MRDADVRSGLTAALSSRLGSARHVLVGEVDIRWSTPARMDMLLVSDRIVGFEIKSDVDSLARLPRQVQAYGDVVERAHLVVGQRHLDAATQLVPDWWSVWSAAWTDDDALSRTVAVRQIRRGRLNPAVSPLAVTTFLSRTDLTSALRSIGERQLSSRSIDELRLMLVGRLRSRRTIGMAREAMLARPDWQQKSLTRRMAATPGSGHDVTVG